MPINLAAPPSQVTTGSPAYDAVFANLQGNILRSHGRNAGYHVFLKFTGPAVQVRKWIREKIAPRLLTAAAQFEQSAKKHADENFDGGLVILFYLSAAGYQYLGLDPKKFASKAFRSGMKDQKDNLLEGVISTTNKDPKPDQWEKGFRDQIHAMVALGDDQKQDETRLLNELSLLKTQLSGIGQVLVMDEGKALRRTVRKGTILKTPEPIEHFGYFDGISQPLFTKEDVENYYASGKGTDTPAAWKPHASLDLLLEKDPFANNADAFGSYLVYRKLYQDFGLFHARIPPCAAAIGASEELTGAMIIGRFQDGTPVVQSDQPDQQYKNDFVFKAADPKGYRCPRHAHIRKVNPRDTTPLTSFDSERRRRIARRGIPYGAPMPDICDAAETDADPHADRGLLFMCFQANIEKQFEFLQRTWVDNPNFPDNVINNPLEDDTGDDPLIGQDKNEKQRWPQKWGDEAAGRKKFNFESAITLKGGEYFFAPSKPSLAAI
jgi:Dyp-type peroxidase family